MSKVLLILGSGGRIGASTAALFGQSGYAVAIAARSLEDGKVNDKGHLQIKADLGDHTVVGGVFEKVRKHFGGPPNVVVYNAAALHPTPPTDPLSLSPADLQADLSVNTTSVLAAAKETVAGFATLRGNVNKAFIYTGNILNFEIMPPLVSLGIGKSATAHLIRVASETHAAKGWRFYYADERKADGSAAFMDLNGPSSAKHYLELADSEEGRPWLQTFVGGEGYRDFEKA